MRSGWSLGQASFSENRRSRSGVLGVEVDEVDDEHAAGQPERGLDRVGEPALGVDGLDDEPVDDDLDGVLVLLLQLRRLGERDDLAVDPGPGVALGLQLAEQVDVLALAAADDRREHLEAGAARAARAAGRRSAAGSAG